MRWPELWESLCMLDGLCHLLATENQGSGFSNITWAPSTHRLPGPRHSNASSPSGSPVLPPRYALTKHIPSPLLSYPIILLVGGRGKPVGKDYPQLQAQVCMLPQRPSQQRGIHPLWVLWLWWFILCVNLARLRDPVVWSNNSLNYIQPSTEFPTPTLPFLALNPETSIQPALFEG